MTFKSLLNWGGLTKSGITLDRFHSGWDHDHEYHHHKSYGYHKGDKGSAALSALALLAFLFLINVMQQSLNEFNGNTNAVNPATATAVLLRDDNIPIFATAQKNAEKLVEVKNSEKNSGDERSAILYAASNTFVEKTLKR